MTSPPSLPTAVLAQRSDESPANWRFANVDYDTALGELRLAGQPVAIEPRPLRLLAELLRHVNEVVTKEELFESVWDGRPTVEHVLTNAVSKLRAALGAEAGARVVTVPRIGYRLAGPVQRIDDATAGAAAFSTTAGQPVPGATDYALERPLDGAERARVWLARHLRLGHAHVFKFAIDGRRLAALKREYTLYRVLMQELGPRDDVARVVGANFTQAPFFLECEYGGQSLLDWADTGVLTTLSVEARLALFLQVARAVAAAHSVGVLHKDLKPGNVLIDGTPRAWQVRLTDFGSGRLLDPTRLAALKVTALGMTQQTLDVGTDSRSGTLMYMAPELMAGQSPTLQSDVYALGMLLYQLVVGDLRRPLATGWQRAVDDPLLVADITVATEGQPQARPRSVDELATRLQTLAQRRAQQQSAETATALAAAERAELQKRRARRPWVWGAMLALSLGLSASLWFYAQATQALTQSRVAADRAQALNDFLTRDVLQSPDMMLVGGSHVPTLLDVLRRAAAQVGQRFKGQPLNEAAARQHLGRVFQRIVSSTDAWRQYDAALKLLEPNVPASDPQLLSVQYELVRLLLEMNSRPDAERLFEAAQKAAPARLLAEPSEVAFLAARAQVNLVEYEMADRALPAAQRVATLADSVPDLDPAMRLEARTELAHLYLRRGDAAAADATLRSTGLPAAEVEAIRHVVQARAMQWLAANARNAGRYQAAERHLAEARSALMQSPQPSELHLGYTASELAHVYSEGGRIAEAATGYREALASFTWVLGQDHQYTRITAVNLAEREVALGHYAAAHALLLAHRPWFNAYSSTGSFDALENALVDALLGLRRFDEALKVQDAIDVKWPLGNGALKGDRAAWQRGRRGMALIGLGRVAEGRVLVAQALAWLEAPGHEGGPPPPWQTESLRSALATPRAKSTTTAAASSSTSP